MDTVTITPDAIKADDNYLIGVELEDFNFNMYTIWKGGQYVSYYAFLNSDLLFHGDDFRPSPLHGPDSLDSIVDLLGFLTCQPGDTDPEYFSKYTAAQLAWAQSHACEQLGGLVSDFHDTDGEYHKDAVKVFKSALV